MKLDRGLITNGILITRGEFYVTMFWVVAKHVQIRKELQRKEKLKKNLRLYLGFFVIGGSDFSAFLFLVFVIVVFVKYVKSSKSHIE